MSSGNGSIASTQYAKTINVSSRGPSPGRPPGAIKYNAVKLKEKKKMGWFKRKFAQWSREVWEEARKYEEVAPPRHDGVSGKSSIRFTIYSASGGHIIEYYKQDRYRDSEGPELVIVSGDQTIGQAVEHILTMEALKS